ncbi:phosphonate C-P lyase system protein PhnH [Arthrobacter sp. M4]|uniref:phosphonate C-P lyase system protein PhnH n=1 Tax=Arthrobacter sp. M4 TaxID=218160 RepID=UPI001CDC888D|nr:phosphonate C-P lyase system protein PhnH [Arthrobacter sp. M4]MCA4132572.1 phosphonate C-P lyase system protein PhnH [Arthrobacter sp. M4]
MNHAPTTVPAPGFTDPTAESQRVFRAVLDAFAHPCRPYPIRGLPEAPDGLGAGLAVVALALFDEDVSVWLHPKLAVRREVTTYLTFHTGTRITGAREGADFVIATPDTVTPFSDLALGTDEAPHQSATIIIDAGARGAGARFTATGPGIEGWISLDAPWAPEGFADAWAGNAALFPRGVDVIVVFDDHVIALPRTTRLRRAVPDTAKEA